ncbi:hypothetical protein EVAR_34676_1 [Eumeta japonica]|uniref:Uncharacterized protein n=1 Tax=Eumeta variegata TaxID=151549 RepID=A0A4C1VG94_EUMVA|nr:hypothetical protein EVAR_34676_1 [Eumeta japonica]
MLEVFRLYSIVDFKYAKVANEISPRYTRGRYRARWTSIIASLNAAGRHAGVSMERDMPSGDHLSIENTGRYPGR